MSMLYMNYTDNKGASHVQWHSCWDVDLFVKTQKQAYEKEEGCAEVITEATYRAAKRVERGRPNG